MNHRMCGSRGQHIRLILIPITPGGLGAFKQGILCTIFSFPMCSLSVDAICCFRNETPGEFTVTCRQGEYWFRLISGYYTQFPESSNKLLKTEVAKGDYHWRAHLEKSGKEEQAEIRWLAISVDVQHVCKYLAGVWGVGSKADCRSVTPSPTHTSSNRWRVLHVCKCLILIKMPHWNFTSPLVAPPGPVNTPELLCEHKTPTFSTKIHRLLSHTSLEMVKLSNRFYHLVPVA